MLHYVYRLTDTNPRGNIKHYIGKRSSKYIDIGKEYFTSSKILNEYFRNNVKQFKIKVVKIFNTSAEALMFEKQYLFRVKASQSPLFYNRCNSGSNGKNDNTGIVHVLSKENGLSMSVSCDEYYSHTEKYIPLNKGKTLYRDSKGNLIHCSKEYAKENNLVGLNYGVVYTKDKNGNKVKVSKEYYNTHRDEFEFREKRIMAYNIKTNENVCVTKEEFENNEDLKGINAKYQREYKQCPYCNNMITIQNYDRHISSHKNSYYWVSNGENIFKCREDIYWLYYKKDYDILNDINNGHKSLCNHYVPLNGKFHHIRYVAKIRKNCYIGKEYENQ